jgi:hypothetical protein
VCWFSLKLSLKRTVLQEAAAASGSGDGGSGVKAVSKAVIQREHQHTATVLCKNLFDPPNPFNRMSEDDIESYKSTVEQKTKTGNIDAPVFISHIVPTLQQNRSRCLAADLNCLLLKLWLEKMGLQRRHFEY